MSLEASMEALKKSVDALNETFSKTSAKPAAAATDPKPAKPAAAPATNGLTYDDIKTPFLALCKAHGAEGGNVGRAICKQFGHESLKTVKPEQFAAVLEVINKKMAELPPAA